MSDTAMHVPDGSVIRLLDPVVANKIAAGEVVQRPASVVKELLDNAIDAGSTRIHIIIEQAGRQLIQVIDNGCGMSSADLKQCFVRHATSKISQIEDLLRIQTMGFRGEAMASIAAVAQVTAKSKRAEDTTGIEIELWGGEERRFGPAATQDGTNVAVRNLFYNVPARRSFLKSDITELRQILSIVQQLALAYPMIEIELIADQEVVYRLSSGSLEDRIVALFGPSYRASLLLLQEETSEVRLYGYLSDPKLAKKSRGEQFLFVNNRPVQHRYLSFTLQTAYAGWLSSQEYPFYCVFLDVDPSTVDVNVHPAKLEVKFEDEKSIISITRSVVNRCLHSHFQVPTIDETIDPSLIIHESGADFSQGFSFEAPRPESGSSSESAESSAHRLNFPSRLNFEAKPIPEAITEQLYGARMRPQGSHLEETKKRALERGEGFWQLHNAYIIAQTRTGLCLIDQQRAHRRILFEHALQTLEQSVPASQQLLFPVTVSLSATDFALLKELYEPIMNLGFDISLLSGNTAVLNGVPMDVSIGDEQTLLKQVLQQYQEFGQRLRLPARERLAMGFAFRTAIPKGKKLSPQEMESLFAQLFACSEPFIDPVSNPTIIYVSLDDLTRPFR